MYCAQEKLGLSSGAASCCCSYCKNTESEASVTAVLFVAVATSKTQSIAKEVSENQVHHCTLSLCTSRAACIALLQQTFVV